MFALVASFALIAAPVDQPKELSGAAQKELKLRLEMPPAKSWPGSGLIRSRSRCRLRSTELE